MADTDFKGYLIKSVKTGEEFPHEYIVWEGWESNDNQREYVKAYRDDNSRDIHLVQANGRKSALTINLRDNLHLKDVRRIRKWFQDAEDDHDIRSIEIKYWDSDLLRYRQIKCYQANPKFKIKKITDNDIIYLGRTVDFVEM